ncbi:YycH family regulatory protein [Paenibacillus xerothermodurans]|uniref:Regulatory protein YycH domain-containing protein n=1 Tax=Paenibacillus xerothermodurans TaxID=1977292 RepID=A0A2W1N2Y4_PAEXE|nr:two-component system activity regulator YycH [Paenibacillus xerothermodurans]PZE19059.1 hypothetical protein CBW46_020370 [Paenibacillus xerothermodurans]
MIEKLKSAALVILVGLSLLQSYYINYSAPSFDPLVQDEYVESEPLGSQAAVEDLLFPDQMVMHLGNQQHTVLYPETEAYTRIFDNVRQRSLEGFRKTSPEALNVNWEEIRSTRQGFEVRFRDGLPFDVLQREQVLQIKGSLPPENDVITRIWFFADPMKFEVRTIFFTDTANTMYEVESADISTKDIERFVTLEGIVAREQIVDYEKGDGDYYLPVQPIWFEAVKLPVTQYAVEQLKQNFFVDPAITRNLSERDGSEIYTDTKRGLKLQNDQRWMTYTDPVATMDGKDDMRENLLSAVQFINQHGGWNGKYSLYKVPQRLLPNNQAFVFRQYHKSLPVINQGSENAGFIKIVMQKGIAASYERSMMIPDVQNAVESQHSLVGGEALAEKLSQYGKRSSILSVFPAYKPIVHDQTLELVPAWTVELRDGTYEFLE